LLGKQLEEVYPLARHVTLVKGLPRDGLPRQLHGTDAKTFLETWRDWWPFLRPRVLQLRNASGYEAEVARCPYLARLDGLICEGAVLPGHYSHRRKECQWRPVSAELLRELAANANLPRLTALKVEPIRTTADELLAFAETPFASRLEELDLWVEVAPNSYETLWAVADTAQHEIHRFVAAHLTAPA
jgi:hypothetical protein